MIYHTELFLNIFPMVVKWQYMILLRLLQNSRNTYTHSPLHNVVFPMQG